MPRKKVDTSLPKPPKTVEDILKQKKKEIGIINEDENLDGNLVEKPVEGNFDSEEHVKEVVEKPRQKAHLAKAREKALQVRQEKIEKMKFLEEYYLKNEKALAIKEKNRKLYTPKSKMNIEDKKDEPVRYRRTPRPSPEPSEDEDSSEEEIVYVDVDLDKKTRKNRKKSVTKKRVKKIIIEESSSDEDNEKDYYRRLQMQQMQQQMQQQYYQQNQQNQQYRDPNRIYTLKDFF